MIHYLKYQSPIGLLTITADNTAVTGLWIDGQKHFAAGIMLPDTETNAHPILQKTAHFLDGYFSGSLQTFSLPLRPAGTDFQQLVWACLLKIPYGSTVTYGQIAKKLSQINGKSMSAQAVGNAVGRNPISILIPCHRVIGANGDLVGYAGGLKAKQALLLLESQNCKRPEGDLLL